MVVIIDYGMGNLRSILNKLQRMEIDVLISSNPEDIKRADKLILPGVGGFSGGIENLKAYNLISVLNRKVIEEKTPILGICLGMQLFTKRSEEGNLDGLGWFDAKTKKFDFKGEGSQLRIPHMGWNSIYRVKNSALLEGILSGSKFYFAHSYHVCCAEKSDIAATTNYGYDFASVIEKDNIAGVQFHPEKSHEEGIKLLRNFCENKKCWKPE